MERYSLVNEQADEIAQGEPEVRNRAERELARRNRRLARRQAMAAHIRSSETEIGVYGKFALFRRWTRKIGSETVIEFLAQLSAELLLALLGYLLLHYFHVKFEK